MAGVEAEVGKLDHGGLDNGKLDDGKQDEMQELPAVHEAPAAVIEEGTLDPVYEAKAKVLNKAIQNIGMGRYQWQVSRDRFPQVILLRCSVPLSNFLVPVLTAQVSKLIFCPALHSNRLRLGLRQPLAYRHVIDPTSRQVRIPRCKSALPYPVPKHRSPSRSHLLGFWMRHLRSPLGLQSYHWHNSRLRTHRRRFAQLRRCGRVCCFVEHWSRRKSSRRLSDFSRVLTREPSVVIDGAID